MLYLYNIIINDRYDDRGYPIQPPPQQAYREPGYPHPKQTPTPTQSYREPGYDGR